MVRVEPEHPITNEDEVPFTSESILLSLQRPRQHPQRAALVFLACTLKNATSPAAHWLGVGLEMRPPHDRHNSAQCPPDGPFPLASRGVRELVREAPQSHSPIRSLCLGSYRTGVPFTPSRTPSPFASTLSNHTAHSSPLRLRHLESHRTARHPWPPPSRIAPRTPHPLASPISNHTAHPNPFRLRHLESHRAPLTPSPRRSRARAAPPLRIDG